jgi:hypothetical protein
MTVTTPAMTVQVREHDKVMEPYRVVMSSRGPSGSSNTSRRECDSEAELAGT